MFMSTVIRIDLDSPVPAYEQILSRLRALLVAGDLPPGVQLPTVRELAVDLGVHHNTVAEAYRHLAIEGWLELRRGRGAKVLGRQAPKPTAEAKSRYVRQLHEMVAKAIAEGVPRSEVAQEMSSLAKRIDEGGFK